MSNTPYEPYSSDSQPEGNKPTGIQPDAAPTVPLNSGSAPHQYGSYSQGTAPGSPYAGSGGQLNGAAYGAPQPPNYNAYGAPQEPQGKKAKNIVGIVSIVLSAIGFVLGLTYFVAFLGWFLLFAGLVVGIVGFFQKGKEKITPSIGVGLSVLGGIASIIALSIALINASMDYAGSAGSTGSSASAAETFSPQETGGAIPGEVSALDGVLKFGETAEYADGLKFTVSEPRTDYTPSNTASQLDESLNQYLAFTVTIENGTDQSYEPFGYIEGNSGGKAIDQVFDAEKGIRDISSAKILPGEKVSYDVAFAVADPANVTLDVTVDFDRDEIIYTNK